MGAAAGCRVVLPVITQSWAKMGRVGQVNRDRLTSEVSREIQGGQDYDDVSQNVLEGVAFGFCVGIAA